jgi:uncharacterized protein YbjT (DUF2867 family)
MATDERDRRFVAVAGATGRFGGIVPALLARGHAVRALARNPAGEAAERIRRLGADVVYGDFDDRDGIARTVAGAQAVFATGTAHRAGPEGELRHGLNLAGAVAAAGAPHLVYVSGDGAAPDSPLPLFRAKFAVEERIRSVDVPHTILAPTYLMENMFNPWNLAHLRAGRLPSPIPVDQTLQQAALADVLDVAIMAVEHPGEFSGRRIAIASDELSAVDAAASLAGVLVRDFEPIALERDALPPGLRALFAWLERTGHSVDIQGLRGDLDRIRWHDFGAWAVLVRDRFGELCPHEPHPVPAPL